LIGVKFIKCAAKRSAYTLVEIMIVLLLLSMVVISIPAFHSFFKRQGVQLAVEQLCTDLQLARLMAINNRKTCTIEFNQPHEDQYTNSLNGMTTSLRKFKGGVCFLLNGPDGKKMPGKIRFQRRGMAISMGDIYLSDATMSHIYRVRISVPGAITVSRWNGAGWY